MATAEILMQAYTDSVQAELLVEPARADDPAFAKERAAALEARARDLLDLLLLDGGAGEPVDARWAHRIETEGSLLWRHGFLLPRQPPSKGSRIDPRWYGASARVTRSLRGRRPFGETLPVVEYKAALPPSRSIWDAVVIAADLERTPRRLTKDGVLRRDERQRLLESLGAVERWDLALRHAWATGLVRVAGDRLFGFPEAHARRLVDPPAILAEELIESARVLLRAVGPDWLDLSALEGLLRTKAPAMASGGLRAAAAALHRMEIIDGAMSAEGLTAVRRASPGPEFHPNFLLTPDLDIMVGQGEMPLGAYGRLCRMAPYTGGDRAHRHKLTRDGIAADLAVGHTAPEDFLASYSRTGVPSSVRQSLTEWARAAERLTLLTGVTVVEHPDGRLERVDEAPKGLRIIDYGADHPPPARFEMVGDTIVVPVGEDALSVRAALRQVAEPQGRDDYAWRFRLAPRPVPDVRAVLETLRRMHAGQQLPGELEASVLAVHDLGPAQTEEALVVHLPEAAADALRRDRICGPMLERQVTETQCLLARKDLPLLRERLAQLGIELT